MDYEKLGAFYLGRGLGDDAPTPLLYDSKDLTTHAVCVGMTGSGKTGLGVVLLEEAAIDGIPIIAIDPKGDLANLLLTFPGLQPADFRPWIDESDAARSGRSADEHARWTADLWRKGLAEWGQQPERIERYASAGERVIYTPGSSAGRPLSVLRSLTAPSASVAADPEALGERISGAVSGLLGLLGIDADPIRSREHILLSNLLARAWGEGRDVDLPSLIRQIQRPPMDRVGVLDLESFYPSRDRAELALTVNNLLASPGFASWTEGEPLDIAKLLYTPDGRPRVSVISIAHLSERERMFVVTLLLGELVTWMRSQPGSRSLRALLYMDEVFGYLPPSANPPSKTPLLTLLKQARAYGVGCVLATQNPVDLDYKALSNAGTWFLGRLQTERDKLRVIDGLEGAAVASFDRSELERTLSGLDTRQFLMNNVHEDGPVLFETRWALSYLAGPLTRAQITRLTADAGPAVPAVPAQKAAAATAETKASAAATSRPAEVQPERPVVPSEVAERFAPIVNRPASGERVVYRPALLARASLHYANARLHIDEWTGLSLLASLPESQADSPWDDALDLGRGVPDLDSEPEEGAVFGTLAAHALRKSSYSKWQKMLKTHLYREHPIELYRCRELKLVSRVGEGETESEGEFRGRVRAASREHRDLKIEKLRKKYAPKLARLQDQVRRAEQRVDVEREQYSEKKLQTAISFGATVLGALFGRKLGSIGNLGRATTAARGAGRTARERSDVARASEKVEVLRERLGELEKDFEADLAEVQNSGDVEPEIELVKQAPRKSDLDVEPVSLVWIPYRVDVDGIATAAHSWVGPQGA